jgi:hypothetical protein
MADHPVTAGDCFSSVAAENGFYNYLTLYNRNPELKAKRPNPNMLVPGDVIKIPAKKVKKESLPLDKEQLFTLDRRKTKLRVAVADVDYKAAKAISRKLTVGAKSTARADGKGLLELEIDPKEKSATLEVGIAPWKPGMGPAVKAAKSPAPYPPPIIPTDFEDKTAPPPTDNLEITWKLQVGSLEPHTTDNGDLERLLNLGIGEKIAATAEEISFAVKSYQRKNQLMPRDKESGKLADIRTDLESRHDQ